MGKGAVTSESSSAISQTLKHKTTVYTTSKPAAGRGENRHAHTDTRAPVPCSAAHNRPTLGAPGTTMHWWATDTARYIRTLDSTRQQMGANYWHTMRHHEPQRRDAQGKKRVTSDRTLHDSLTRNVQKRQIDGDKGRLGVFWGAGVGTEANRKWEWGLMGGEYALNWFIVMGAPLGKVTKNHCSPERRAFLYVKCTTATLFKRKSTHYTPVFICLPQSTSRIRFILSQHLGKLLPGMEWGLKCPVDERIFLKNKTMKFCLFP